MPKTYDTGGIIYLFRAGRQPGRYRRHPQLLRHLDALVAGPPESRQNCSHRNVDTSCATKRISLSSTARSSQPGPPMVRSTRIFRGNGRLQIEIPNGVEGQQLVYSLSWTRSTLLHRGHVHLHDDFVAEISKQ